LTANTREVTGYRGSSTKLIIPHKGIIYINHYYLYRIWIAEGGSKPSDCARRSEGAGWVEMKGHVFSDLALLSANRPSSSGSGTKQGSLSNPYGTQK